MPCLKEYRKLKGSFKIVYSLVDYGQGLEKRVSILPPGSKDWITQRSSKLKFREMEAKCFDEYKKRN